MGLKRWGEVSCGGLKGLGKEFGLISTTMGRNMKQESAITEG